MSGDALPWSLPWLRPAWERAVAQKGHALIVHGPEGVGQWELSLWLAQTWLCEHPTDQGEPCGACESCRLLRAGAHPDLRALVPDALRTALPGLSGDTTGESSDGSDGDARSDGKGKSAGRDIRVADVRSAIDWARQTPSRDRAKVLIVYPAQRMNAVSANALLKTLEEPPGRLRIVLACSDPWALLPTLRSRCQRVGMALPPPVHALDWLRARGLGAQAEPLLRLARGRPMEAWALHQEGWTPDRVRALPMAVAQGRVEALAGVAVPRAVHWLQTLCADLMQLHWGQAPQVFASQDLPPGADPLCLSHWWKQLLQAARHAEHPWSAALKLEALVLQGQACWPSRSPSPPASSSSSPAAGPRHRHVR